MSIPALVEQAREWALATLTDTVAITRDGEPTTDDLGTVIDGAPVAVYDGPGLVQDTATSRDPVVQAGEQDVDALGYVCKVPVVVDPRPGDRVRVVESLDPRHVGRGWRITAVPTQAWAVLHRCILDVDEQGGA